MKKPDNAPVRLIEISGGVTIPALAWHTPPWEYEASGDLLPYQPGEGDEGSGAADAIRRAFGGDLVLRQGILWLAPEWPKARWCWTTWASDRAVCVDLGDLDLERLRFAWSCEGYVWHLGPIPARTTRDRKHPEEF